MSWTSSSVRSPGCQSQDSKIGKRTLISKISDHWSQSLLTSHGMVTPHTRSGRHGISIRQDTNAFRELGLHRSVAARNITDCVDASDAVADRCPGTQHEPWNCVECETCFPNLEGQWSGRIVQWRAAQGRRWSGFRASCQVISTSWSTWVTEWTTRDGAYGHCGKTCGSNLRWTMTCTRWISTDVDLTAGVDGLPPPGSTRLPLYFFRGLPARVRLPEFTGGSEKDIGEIV